MGRTKTLDSSGTAERAARARAFLAVAREYAVAESSAARAVATSNAVEAGIAAGDAICGRRLGEHSNSDRHADAVDLLRRAASQETGAVNALRRLLDVKSRAQYGSSEMSRSVALENLRRAESIVEAMERVLGSP